MTTTAIFAEILIAGFEAAVWLAFLGITIADRFYLYRGAYSHWLHPARLLSASALATALALAGAYGLGILVDRLADSAEKAVSKRRPIHQVRPKRVATMRMEVLRAGGQLAAFFEYQRSRARVARATALNALFAAVAVPVFLRFDAPGVATLSWLAAGAGLLLLAAGAHAAFRRIELAYVKRLNDAYSVITEPKGRDVKLKTKHAKLEITHAATVAYKGSDPAERVFLLVTTKKDQEMWTLPKGGRDDKEELVETAVRETLEEARATGAVDASVVAVYRYPERKGPERLVAAFLLEVDKQNIPPTDEEDAQRTISWFGFDEALEKLSAKRDPEYARQAELVLRTALARLDGR